MSESSLERHDMETSGNFKYPFAINVSHKNDRPHEILTLMTQQLLSDTPAARCPWPVLSLGLSADVERAVQQCCST